jgi:hypothetical protein
MQADLASETATFLLYMPIQPILLAGHERRSQGMEARLKPSAPSGEYQDVRQDGVRQVE